MDVCHIYVPRLFFLCMEFIKVFTLQKFPRSWHGFYGTVTSFLVEMFEVSYSKFRYNLSLLNFMYLSFSN